MLPLKIDLWAVFCDNGNMNSFYRSVAVCGAFAWALVGIGNRAEALAVERTFRSARETMGSTNLIPIQEIDEADWIWSATVPTDEKPAFARFRKSFVSDGSPLVLDVSADERFVLKLDGAFVARGPYRGFVNRWNYQTYTLNLAPGEHVLEASVAKLGRARPAAQTTWKAGFVLKASGTYDAQLTTGKAAWQAADLKGTTLRPDKTSNTLGLVGGTFRVEGASWIDEQPPASAFGPARIVRKHVVKDVWGGRTPGWMLFPATLADQQEVRRTVGAFVTGPDGLRAAFNAALTDGRVVSVPAHTSAALLWDLGDYYCAYPELVVSGGTGAEITWLWDESLRTPDGKKGNRNAFVGKAMTKGFGDTFVLDGRPDAPFTTPWWRAGRWCELTIKTGDEPLTVKALALRETHYPIVAEASFDSDDPSLSAIATMCRRTLENCSHETLCDCPHWEQLMYSGDTRDELELLAALTPDERPRRTAITLFDESRRGDGLPAMAVPLMEGKDSSTYAMCWVMMVGDYALKGPDPAWLKAHLPGMRSTLDALARYENAEGLVAELPGWNYVDERLGNYGVPKGGLPGEKPGALINLQYLQALQGAAQAEAAVGETMMARRWQEKADHTAASIRKRFFVASRGLLAETEDHKSFTAHSQCLGVLTGVLTQTEYDAVSAALLDFKAAGFGPMGTYFQYYLFEAAFKIGRSELFFNHLDPWRAMLAAGLRTATENGLVECRSDCHAWSASPLYFFHAGIAGVRPSGVFWSSAEVRPQPGPLARVVSTTPTPKGPVKLDLRFDKDGPHGTVTLPEDLPGTFVWGDRRLALSPGANKIK